MLEGMYIDCRNQCTDGVSRPINESNHVGRANLHFGFLFCLLFSIFYLFVLVLISLISSILLHIVS